jgi:hypothetical protein
MNWNELGKSPVPELSEECGDVSNYVTRRKVICHEVCYWIWWSVGTANTRNCRAVLVLQNLTVQTQLGNRWRWKSAPPSDRFTPFKKGPPSGGRLGGSYGEFWRGFEEKRYYLRRESNLGTPGCSQLLHRLISYGLFKLQGTRTVFRIDNWDGEYK